MKSGLNELKRSEHYASPSDMLQGVQGNPKVYTPSLRGKTSQFLVNSFSTKMSPSAFRSSILRPFMSSTKVPYLHKYLKFHVLSEMFERNITD